MISCIWSFIQEFKNQIEIIMHLITNQMVTEDFTKMTTIMEVSKNCLTDHQISFTNQQIFANLHEVLEDFS